MPEASGIRRFACLAVVEIVVACAAIAGSAGRAWAEPIPPTHAEMIASPLRCPTCHPSATVLFAAAGIPDGMTHAGTDEACLGCHTGGGDAPQVYGGDPARYAAASGFGHDEPEEADCVDCHSVHGPWVANPALSGYLLRVLDYQLEAVAEADPETAARDRALSAWCTGCHPLWPAGPTDAGGVPLSAEGGGCANHPFGDAEPGKAGTACEDCFSCHGANGPGAISHDTPGADAGLVTMGEQEATAPAPDRSKDGICLRCHQGVGTDF